ncbi:hypothetical protein CQW23_25668 [Capsicum baccatum]|uniref:Uncharacterized protein n=1 Tax=Capsicum baccatum TaxID=33114 RepID=A0A2G2VLM6_CAPBA|nr:hypothetical protein CQW23_25668 [Capsicum baccatum]
MGIRRNLWVDENDQCKFSVFAIPKNKKVAFLKTSKNISVPDGYSSNICHRIDLDQKKNWFKKPRLSHSYATVVTHSNSQCAFNTGLKQDKRETVDCFSEEQHYKISSMADGPIGLVIKQSSRGPSVSTSQGTESALSFLDKTNLSPPIKHSPELSRPIYSASHPALIDQDTPHLVPTVFPESQPSPIDHLTSYPSLVSWDSSQPSPIGQDLSHPFIVGQDSSQPSFVSRNSSQPSFIGRNSLQASLVGQNSSQPYPIGWDSSHPYSVDPDSSQPSRLSHSISYLGLINQNSSQLSRSVHST